MASQTNSEINPSSGFCSKNSIFYSKRKPVSLPSDPYLDFVTYTFSQSHFGTTAFIDASTDHRLSYEDLWRSVKALSISLSSLHGVLKGQVVLLLSPNSFHFPIVSLAVMSIGAIFTTTNPLNTQREIASQIADSSPVLAFTTRPLLQKLAGHDFPVLLLEEMNYQLPRTDSNPGLLPREPVRQDDAAIILYSSGTTGTSKGVVSTHRSLIAATRISQERFPSRGTSTTFICTVPMFHVYGLVGLALGKLSAGSTVVILPQFNMDQLLRAVVEYQVTYLPLVPPILVALLRSGKVLPSGRLRAVTCGAAPLRRDVAEEFRKRYPLVGLFQGYGMTETTLLGASINTEEESRHDSSAGLLAPNTEARIVHPSTGEFLPENRTGELWIRGPSVMRGYFKNPEATKLSLDSEGWLRTGDLCYINQDGYLFVIDRLKELIKYKGYQVAPAELEALLIEHPDIIDAAVIPFPDKEVGEYPMAYVVKKEGSKLTEESAMHFIENQVASYKKIRKVAFLKTIPKNAAGKVLRKELVKLATSISML